MIYLFLNSISTGEVIIILVFILMFFGSKGVPGIAQSLGKGLRQLKDATDDIKRDIRHSVEDIEKEVKSNMDNVNITKEAKKSMDAMQKNIDDIVSRPKRFVNDNVKDFTNTVEKSVESSKKDETSKDLNKNSGLNKESGKVDKDVDPKSETV